MTISVIKKFILFIFFGIVVSGCALEDDPSVTDKKDIVKPVLTEITTITTPTNDRTPNYTFSSSESGSITYGGSCSSSTTSAISGNNTITLVSLSDGTYSNCTIIVTDSAGNISSTLTITTFTIEDTVSPTIEKVTAVTTPTNDTTPDYTFSSDEAGTITYGGFCSSSTTSATTGHNTITLISLNDGTYSDCTVSVTDEAGNISSTLSISTFTVDITTPTISEVTSVTNPTNDSTPNYTFSSSESGTITYGGSCSSSTTSATSGNNNITLNTLSEWTYSNCTITVTDEIGFVSSSLTITSFTVDLTASTLVEVTAVTTLTNDNTPDYTFSSSEAGTITYGGSCSSSTTSATTDNNTITLNSLGDNTYSDCTITVTDNASNSVTLNMSSFTIDTTSPTIEEITAITPSTTDTTPDYTFSSDESGTISYGGSCTSSTTAATVDNNTITLSSLSTGTYSDCTITVTDTVGNDSNTLTMTSFLIAEQMGGSFQGTELSLSTVVTTIAGSGSPGATDGTGTSAGFRQPYGITTDGTNLYIADSDNHRIRKIVISTGVVTTLAGSSLGYTDSTGISSKFSYPYGITTDGTNLYVADSGNKRIRQIE